MKKYISPILLVIPMLFSSIKSVAYSLGGILLLFSSMAFSLINNAQTDEVNIGALETGCNTSCEYKVKSGDSLSQIFRILKIKNAVSTIKKLDEADAEFLHIDTIRPGYILRFTMENDLLQVLEMEINIAKKIQYTRQSNGFYRAKEINAKGDWQNTMAIGTINNSFYLDASADGLLTKNELQAITEIFKDKINFNRDFHPGDKFKVFYKTLLVEEKETGQTEILAVVFQLKRKTVSAFLHEDGNYYDENGDSLQTNTFLTYPLEKKAQISSHFNPSRVHPVTGKLSPHNGTDFAVDVGTPVVSAADGVVSIVRDHPYAGKYIVIDHGTQYKTRYLHNSKILVKKGDVVTKGQRIALSGRSGRVSGAHLHYEVLINGRPVNAMKTGILPMTKSVAAKDMKQFRSKVQNYQNEFALDMFTTR